MYEKTWVDAFTDGRDVSPTRRPTDIAELPLERVASVSGRYYAMDRDKRWERIDLASTRWSTARHAGRRPLAAVQASYDAGSPTSSSSRSRSTAGPRIDPDDGAVFFNFRPDRGASSRGFCSSAAST